MYKKLLWIMGLACLLSFGVQAQLNIQGITTEKMTSPTNGSTVKLGDSFVLEWGPVSSAYATDKYSLGYYMLYHVQSKTLYYPGKTASFEVRNFPEGTHSFRVRAVQRLNGQSYYGGYSSDVTVNIVNPVVRKQTHYITGVPSEVPHTDSIRVSWSPLSEFDDLNWDYYSLGYHNSAQSNGYSYEATGATSKTYSNLPAGSKQCFKVAGMYAGKFGFYSNTECTRVFYNIQNEQTHDLSIRNQKDNYAENEIITLDWTARNATYESLDLDYYELRTIHNGTESSSFSSTTSKQISTAFLTPGEYCFSVRMRSKGRDGIYSEQRCVVINKMASSIFQGGEIQDVSSCFPPDLQDKWFSYRFSKADNHAYNGHILGVSKGILQNIAPGKYHHLKCGWPDDVDKVNGERTRLTISEDAFNQIETGNSHFYVKTHVCDSETVNCHNRNRAELSYDIKSVLNSAGDTPEYSAGQNFTYTQEGDILWVGYRFNIVNGFPQTESHYIQSGELSDRFAHISQFHPATKAWGGSCQESNDPDTSCNLNRGHAPAFALIINPGTQTGQSKLKFITNLFKDENGTVGRHTVYLGAHKTIAHKQWYQVKIGIKFSTSIEDGWAVAAIKRDGDPNAKWDYFSKHGHKATKFKAVTLHAAPCQISGAIGKDCVSRGGYLETVFKAGAYFAPDMWKGETDKHLELLMDDFFATNNVNSPAHRWPFAFDTASWDENALLIQNNACTSGGDNSNKICEEKIDETLVHWFCTDPDGSVPYYIEAQKPGYSHCIPRN